MTGVGVERPGAREAELAREQRVVDHTYTRLDELRELARRRLAETQASTPGGTTHAARTERDAFATLYAERLAQLEQVDSRLVFGRLDTAEAGTRYVGRIGVSDESQAVLLTDWRAPAAEPFYRATAAKPDGVVRRRHLSLRGRRVVGVEDDVLDASGLDAVLGEEATLVGEGALVAALQAHRTGRMRDIVATLQAEQDRVVRAPLAGVLVVQGGPGTGKTAVALHRAAYLLYAHRDRIARSGVLVVGPNTSFLRYIEQVLPALGETGVLMATLGELYPGVRATGTERDDVAALKGDLRMVGVVAEAVRDRQRVPDTPVPLDVDGRTLRLRPQTVRAARGAARQSGRPHNLARVLFVRHVLDDLARQLADALHLTLDAETRGELLTDLRAAPDVRREVNLCWLPLTPRQLVSRLLADPGRLERAGGALTPRERGLLLRDLDAPLTPADVPLLDEAAELLGADDDAQRVQDERSRHERAREVDYAREVVAMLQADGLVSAEELADRQAVSASSLTVAERAATDREWAFGHVVVDEAQEVSDMAWRLLARRCPSRSFTVVGDVAQTGSAAGTSSWDEALDPWVQGRWRVEELTVNYRTPQAVMDVAAAVVAAAGVPVAVPSSVREGGPDAVAVQRVDDVVAALAVAGPSLVAETGEGRGAVVVPDALAVAAHKELSAALGPAAVRVPAEARDATLTVTTVREVKGLEFDVVAVLEPGDLLAQSPRGVHDLYVALTRTTRRLVVLHAGALPEGFPA